MKNWSHPPESNRRPTDYEWQQGSNIIQRDPTIANNFRGLGFSSLWMLESVCTQFSDRTRTVQSYHKSASRLIAYQMFRYNSLCRKPFFSPVRELSVSSILRYLKETPQDTQSCKRLRMVARNITGMARGIGFFPIRSTPGGEEKVEVKDGKVDGSEGAKE